LLFTSFVKFIPRYLISWEYCKWNCFPIFLKFFQHIKGLCTFYSVSEPLKFIYSLIFFLYKEYHTLPILNIISFDRKCCIFIFLSFSIFLRLTF
jgi:hypothetical protein